MASIGGDASFAYKTLFMAIVILLLFPMFLGVFAPSAYHGPSESEIMQGYTHMTGQAADTKVSVWPLAGIYLPFTGGFYDDSDDGGQYITYGYTEDGWLYGSEIKQYSPSQYLRTNQAYTVYKDDAGVFRYLTDSADYSEEYGTGHRGRVMDGSKVVYPGDLYTEVNFDPTQKSDIFFVESSRVEDDLGHFKYDYTGYRMAFKPVSSYTGVDADGNRVAVTATTTSLSLVWYQYLGGLQSGITGQLVLSGSSGGIAYLNAANILSAFNSQTSTAPFNLVFNGVTMTVYIRIDPIAITTEGMTIEDAYNQGRWSIMVTSQSVDASAYTGTDYSKNPMKLLETMFDLFTFNLDDYNLSPWLGTLCTFLYMVPLYIALISLALTCAPQIWILVGILAVVEALGTIGQLWPF